MTQKNKKEYAPTIKLYPGSKEGTFNTNINDLVLKTLEDLTARMEKGGKISIRPVSEAYKSKCEEGKVPEFELTVYTAEETAAHKAWGQSQRSESATDGI